MFLTQQQKQLTNNFQVQTSVSQQNYQIQDNVQNQLQQKNNVQIHQNQMDCIIQSTNGFGGVYLGSVDAANNKKQLLKQGIKSVLTLCSETEIQYFQNEQINHKMIPIVDDATYDLYSFFKECHDFIDQGRCLGNVLVHCIVGVSRSATVILSYLMTQWNMILEESLKHVICFRPIINPNIGFITQLLEYERFLYGKIYSNLTPDLTYFSIVQNNQNYAPQQNLSYQIMTPKRLNVTSQGSSQIHINNNNLSGEKSTDQIYFSLRCQADKGKQITKVNTGWPVTIPFSLKYD